MGSTSLRIETESVLKVSSTPTLGMEKHIFPKDTLFLLQDRNPDTRHVEETTPQDLTRTGTSKHLDTTVDLKGQKELSQEVRGCLDGFYLRFLDVVEKFLQDPRLALVVDPTPWGPDLPSACGDVSGKEVPLCPPSPDF